MKNRVSFKTKENNSNIPHTYSVTLNESENTYIHTYVHN